MATCDKKTESDTCGGKAATKPCRAPAATAGVVRGGGGVAGGGGGGIPAAAASGSGGGKGLMTSGDLAAVGNSGMVGCVSKMMKRASAMSAILSLPKSLLAELSSPNDDDGNEEDEVYRNFIVRDPGLCMYLIQVAARESYVNLNSKTDQSSLLKREKS